MSLPSALRLLPPSLLAHACLLALSPAAARAHGDDQMVLAALTEEIARAPEIDLFIRRGEVLRHLKEWNRAEADFAEAARRDPALANVDYFRARLWLEAGEPQRALPFVKRFVGHVPAEAEGRFLRGDILAALGRSAAAAADYAAGLERTPQPRPEHFLRHAQLLGAPPSGDDAAALAALDAGIARVGPVVTLLDAAIALEIERKDYDAALRRIDVALEHAPRRETWLVRRAGILTQAGRPAEAAADYREALAAIESLPPARRQSAAVASLAAQARRQLSHLPR